MKTICFIIGDIKKTYPNLLGKYEDEHGNIRYRNSARLLAAELALYYELNNIDYTKPFPTEEEFDRFLVESNKKDTYFPLKQRLASWDIQSTERNSAPALEVHLDEQLINSSFETVYGIRPEPKSEIARQEQCSKEFSYQERYDAAEYLYRAFSAKVRKPTDTYDTNTLKQAIKSQGGVSGIWNTIYNELVNIIVRYTNPGSREAAIQQAINTYSKTAKYANTPIGTLREMISASLDKRKHELSRIVSNFTALIEDANYKLLMYEDIRVNPKTSEIEEHVIENLEDTSAATRESKEDDMEIHARGLSFSDDYNTVSSMSTMSVEVRRILNNIKQVNINGVAERTPLGTIRYMDGARVHGIILNACQNMIDEDDLIPSLEAIKEIHPWIQQVIELFQPKEASNKAFNEASRLKTLFFRDMNRAYVQYWGEFASSIDKENLRTYNSKRLNKSRLHEYLLQRWSDNYQGGHVLTENSAYKVDRTLDAAALTVLKKELADILNLYNNGVSPIDTNGEIFNKLKHLLRAIAVDVKDDTLLKVLKDPNEDTFSSIYHNLNGLIGKLAEKKYYGKDTDLIEDFGGYYRDLAFKFQSDAKDIVEPNMREGDTTRYLFVPDNHIQRLVKKLKNVRPDKKPTDSRFKSYYDEFINREFKQFNWFFSNSVNSWNIEVLNDFENDPAFRSAFELSILLKQDNTESYEFRSIESLIAQINEYRNGTNNITKKDGSSYQVTRYFTPLAAEAGVIYMMTLKKYDNIDDINRRLARIVVQEVNRILECRKRKELYLNGKLKASDLIDNYDRLDDTPGNPQGGKKFHFFPQLNKFFDENGNHPIIDLVATSQDTTQITPDIEAKILEYLTPIMNSSFEEELAYYKSIGLMETTKSGNNIYLNMPQANAIEELRKFFYNSCYAQAQIIELLSTDLAFYKDHADFIKRAKEYHATGTRVNPSAVWFTDKTATAEEARVSDGNMRFIVVNDVIKPSVNLNKLEAIFDAHNMNAAEKKVALSLFNSVNSTDAQSFRTLKSYRKIMVMKGTWNDDLEATYNRIRSGEWSWADIDSMFGAIKPYVFSFTPYSWQDEKGINHTIKQNIQIKTAEAALLTLYAQICTMGENSAKLQALVKFMENEESGGNDIDVLVFESAIKHGGQGKLDLESTFNYVTNPDGTISKQEGQPYDNSPEGVQAMLDYLESTTQLHSATGVNPTVVHSVSYRDYLEQQQVPEHIFDTIQLVGTQLRKLVPADIDRDELIDISSIPGLVAYKGTSKIKYGDLLDLYNKIITENILQAFNELRDDFTSIEKIEELLKDQVMNSSDYSPDLLSACTLVANPEGGKMFNIPLHDPIQSRKIQSLLNSILKNRITRQYIKGGACVQVAAYTYDLNIRFKDKNGKELLTLAQLRAKQPNISKEEFKEYYKGAHIDCVECYLPAYSKEIVNYLKDKSNDGILRIADLPDEVRDKVCRMVGYRIPTEDKYSMLPLKIVGFLPQSCSSTIMLPADWVAISGSDMDVDKLYMMFRELYTDNNGNIGVVEYDYSSEPQNQTDVNGTPLAKRNNAYIDLVETILRSEHSADKILDPGHFINKKIAARITRISKNVPIEGIEALKEQYGIDVNDPNVDQLLYEKLCSMSPKELDTILSLYEKVQNPLAPSTWAINRERIANSGSMIGVYANHNVNHALLQHTNVGIKKEFSFMIDNSDERMLNLINTKTGVRILKHNAENIGASVDDVKDPTLADTNVNMFTGDIDALLSDLGHRKQTVAMLLNQPIVLEMTRLFMQHNAGESKFDVIDAVLNHYIAKVQNLYGNSQDIRTHVMKNLSSTNIFTGGNMFSNILQNRRDPNNKEYLLFQVYCGALFNRLMHIGSDLSDIVRWCKADTTNGAAGPDIATTTSKIVLGQQILDKARFDKNYTLEGVIDTENPSNNIIKLGLYRPGMDIDALRSAVLNSPFPITQAMYTCGIEAGNEFFRNLFPYYSPSVQKLMEKFEKMTRSGKLDVRLKNLILRDLTLYWLTGVKGVDGFGMFDVFWDVNGNPYYVGQNGTVTYGDVLRRWIEEFPSILDKRKRDLGDKINPVVQRLIKLMPNAKQNRKLPEIAFRNVGHLSTNLKWIAGNQLYDLIDKGELWERELAKQLMIYAGLKNGFDFGPNSYIHLANTLFRKEAHPLYLQGIRSMLSSEFDDAIAGKQGDEYFYQFIYNHLDERALVPEVDIKQLLGAVKVLPAQFTVTNVSRIMSNKYFTDRFKHDASTMLDFICVNHEGSLYYFEKFPDIANDSVTYRNIRPIGIKNELLSYHRTAKEGDGREQLDTTLNDLHKIGSMYWGDANAVNTDSTPVSMDNRGEATSQYTAPIVAPRITTTEIKPVVTTSIYTPTQPVKTINIYAGTGENADLSNFAERPLYPSSALIKGNFRTVEGAFQAQKLGANVNTLYDSPYQGEAYEILQQLEKASGAEAKRIGRNIKGVNISKWDKFAPIIMKSLIRNSFEQNPQALQRLLATGNATLTHNQDKGKWGTEFPRILMEVREELKAEHPELSSAAQQTSQKETPPTLFVEEPTTGYRNRTIKNARADATIAFAVDFNSAGERLTRSSVIQQGKKYIPVDTNNPEITDELVESIVNQLNEVNAKSLNIAGNGIYTLKGKYTQEQVDNYVYELLSRVLKSPNLTTSITSIRSGGQTGYDEAGIKAAQRLGIVNGILAPKGWKFRDVNGKDISDEQAFKARFSTPQQTTQRLDISTISDKTEAYGVEISNGSQDFWNKISKVNDGWQLNNPNGIVAYRRYGDKPQTFSPATVNSGWIGNPFSTDQRGATTVQQFYDWLTTGNNFGNSRATEKFRQAIIQKILATPEGSPVLYYTELGRPSHATVIGYLINNKQKLQSAQAPQQVQTLTHHTEEYDTLGTALSAIKDLKADDSTLNVDYQYDENTGKYIVLWEEIPEETTNTEENKPECGGTGNLRSGNGSNTLNQVTNNFNN